MGKRVYTAEYKIQVVLEVLKEEKTLSEIASERNINPNVIRNWRKEFLEKAPQIFEGSKREKENQKRESELEEEKSYLLEKIGPLTVERDWLKKKSVEIFGHEYEKKFSKRP
jgi:transposase-like protein